MLVCNTVVKLPWTTVCNSKTQIYRFLCDFAPIFKLSETLKSYAVRIGARIGVSNLPDRKIYIYFKQQGHKIYLVGPKLNLIPSKICVSKSEQINTHQTSLFVGIFNLFNSTINLLLFVSHIRRRCINGVCG